MSAKTWQSGNDFRHPIHPIGRICHQLSKQVWASVATGLWGERFCERWHRESVVNPFQNGLPSVRGKRSGGSISGCYLVNIFSLGANLLVKLSLGVIENIVEYRIVLSIDREQLTL